MNWPNNIHRGESSKFLNLELLQVLKCAICLHNIKFKWSNVIIIQELVIIICQIQDFEADFL